VTDLKNDFQIHKCHLSACTANSGHTTELRELRKCEINDCYIGGKMCVVNIIISLFLFNFNVEFFLFSCPFYKENIRFIGTEDDGF